MGDGFLKGHSDLLPRLSPHAGVLDEVRRRTLEFIETHSLVGSGQIRASEEWHGPQKMLQRTFPPMACLSKSKNQHSRLNDAMYVELRDGNVYSPSTSIEREDAEGIIHTVNVAIERIIEMTEIMGEQIGTKGFMK